MEIDATVLVHAGETRRLLQDRRDSSQLGNLNEEQLEHPSIVSTAITTVSQQFAQLEMATDMDIDMDLDLGPLPEEEGLIQVRRVGYASSTVSDML